MNIYTKYKETFIKTSVRSGVTLVELLIVVGIITIISLAIIPSYMDFSQKKDFNNKVEVMVAELMNVRNKALAGAVHLASDGTPENVSWGLQPAQNCDLKKYYLGYLPEGSTNFSTFVVQSTLDLPENVAFVKGAAPTECDTIVFRRLEGTPMLDVDAGETSKEIILRYGTGATSQTRTITVNSAGRISYN